MREKRNMKAQLLAIHIWMNLLHCMFVSMLTHTFQFIITQTPLAPGHPSGTNYFTVTAILICSS